MILNLKDELQEIKAKVNMESSYVKKSTDLQVHEAQKRCNNAENILDKEIQVSPSPWPLLEGISS